MAFVFGLATSTPPAGAAEYWPTTFDDPRIPYNGCWNPCGSLREAVLLSEQDPEHDEIFLSAGYYQLTLRSYGADDDAWDGDLDIWQDLTIRGAGAGQTIIDANAIDRVFDIRYSGNLTIMDVTLFRGSARPDPWTTHAHGGAIHNHGSLTLVRSSLVENDVPLSGWGGGGLANAGGAYLASVSIFSNTVNTAQGNVAYGGGIENMGSLNLVNVTIGPNRSPYGEGLAARGGAAVLKSTIVASQSYPGTVAESDCYGQIAYSENNLFGDGSCGSGPVTDPQFDFALTTSDGLAYLLPLRSHSPAIDTGSSTTGSYAYTDELGTSRPRDGNGDGVATSDIGAYEVPRWVPERTIGDPRPRPGP